MNSAYSDVAHIGRRFGNVMFGCREGLPVFVPEQAAETRIADKNLNKYRIAVAEATTQSAHIHLIYPIMDECFKLDLVESSFQFIHA